MIVTIVHNDTDSVKLHIKELRQNLSNVKPKITFKSCCTWDFNDSIFEENQAVLLMISKRNRLFVEEFLQSLVQYREFHDDTTCRGCSIEATCRVCVVAESEEPSLKEDLEKIIGKEEITVVDNLQDSFRWLPKVCTFLFEKRRSKTLQNCVIPKVKTGSKSAILRDSLIKGLTDIDINVSEEFQEASPRCCILIKSGSDDNLITTLKDETDSVTHDGGTVIEYSVSSNKKIENEASADKVSYVADNKVLFVLHILFLLGVIYIEPRRQHVYTEYAGFEFRYNCCFCPTSFIGRFLVVAVVLGMLNPSMLLFFLTPFPYVALQRYRVTGKSNLWNICLMIWMVLCTSAMVWAIVYVTVRNLGMQTFVLLAEIAGYFVITAIQIKYALLAW